jgi:hypothetical protein
MDIKGLERIAGEQATADAAKLWVQRVLKAQRAARIRATFVAVIQARCPGRVGRPSDKEMERRRGKTKRQKASRRANRHR